MFGIASLPLQTLEVLARIARWSQVFVCVHNPCRDYWADIVSGQELLRRHQSRHPRKAGQPDTLGPDDLHLHAHPLLAAWGKLGRDYIAALDHHDDAARRDASARELRAIDRTIDVFVDSEAGNLLQQIQQDILELRPLPEIRAEHRSVDPAADASLRFHVAHGPQREVEILHDQLLAAFSADPTLKPRDVIVMVPDIESYAPHVQAVFGLPERDDPRFIPFSLADRAPRQFDPLVHALELLLDLPQSRVAASDVLDLIRCRRCARASASARTSSRCCTAGSAMPACAGGCTASTGRRSACPKARRPRPTPGSSACAECCSATRPDSAPPRGTTSSPTARSAGSRRRRWDRSPRCSSASRKPGRRCARRRASPTGARGCAR